MERQSGLPAPPSRLGRRVGRRKVPRVALAVPITAIVVAIGVVATAFGAGGVTTVCIPDSMASNGNGGFNDPVVGPATESVQRSTGSTRQVIVWQGTPLKCPDNNVGPCDLRYDKGESTSYSKVINISGGLGATGGAIPVPFPIISATGSVVNETKTASWDESITVHVNPGTTATPTLAVDYQEWFGDFVGAYHYAGESNDKCHAYYLSPNDEFGNWHGEVASKEYATFL